MSNDYQTIIANKLDEAEELLCREDFLGLLRVLADEIEAAKTSQVA